MAKNTRLQSNENKSFANGEPFYPAISVKIKKQHVSGEMVPLFGAIYASRDWPSASSTP